MKVESNIISTFKEIFQTALISLVVFLVVYIFLVQPHRVKGDSMVPTFEDGELLLTEKIAYRFGDVERGDVVVFEAPIGRNVDFIKRVIGLPGEKIEIRGDAIYINGLKLEEEYLGVTTQGNADLKLGENEYFVMGDNRSASSDSRAFGAIKRSSIRGRVWFVYWPIISTNVYAGARVISGVHY